MKIVFIGEDNRTADIASLSIRLRWPGATLPYAATATEGLELVERDWPDMVLLHPDLSLTRAIHDLRDFSNGPLWFWADSAMKWRRARPWNWALMTTFACPAT